MADRRTIFVDRSLGCHDVVNALRAVGETVVAHDDQFEDSTDDEVWLAEAGRNDWIAVTKDVVRTRSSLQRLAVATNSARLFVLRTTSPLKGPSQARAIVKAVPKMHRIADLHPAPLIARVYKNGAVMVWRRREELLLELSRHIP